jgi:hypothetical protein
MKKSLLFLLFIYSFAHIVYSQTILVKPQNEIATVSPLFWGANFLNWIEDDAALADGKLLTALKKLPCTVLRYPGGTIADNFNWKTATLDNVNLFPFESGESESNFDEFMVFCQNVGAEPLLVVNTQSWFLKDKVAEGAQYAADWVEYCKEKGYKVKYWEIGNETYWHPIMTAKEYGALVNDYAAAMRKVDPSIIISANGHWDINMVGTKERTDPAKLAGIKALYNSISSKEESSQLKQFSDEFTTKDVTIGNNKWWNDLISVCGDNIDMISVHWYYEKNALGKIDSKINQLKSFLKSKKPHKNYKFCLSEFNCNDLDTGDRVSGFAESLGRFLVTDVDLATFWPLRLKGMEQRAMLSLNDKSPQYPYQIFKLFSKQLQGKMIACESPNGFYTFASKSDSQISMVISGRKLKESANITVNIESADFKSKKISAVEYKCIEKNKSITLKETPTDVINKAGKLRLTVSPKTFVLIVVE